MSVPHLLVVDDSEAILAYEAAALSSQYTLSTATNGREALAKLGEIRPDAVLLDLSMAHMTGDELLLRMQADATLRNIPVIVVSSERVRGEACLERGARAFLPKPIRALQLRATLARILDEERRRVRGDELPVLFLGIGTLELGIPLDPVREVLPYPMTQRLPFSCDYLAEAIDYRGTLVRVLDLGLRLGVAYTEPLHERKLVLARVGEGLLAISVDRVREPEGIAAGDLLKRARPGGAVEMTPGATVLLAIVRTQEGPVPVVEPEVFLSEELSLRFSAILSNWRATDD